MANGNHNIRIRSANVYVGGSGKAVKKEKKSILTECALG